MTTMRAELTDNLSPIYYDGSFYGLRRAIKHLFSTVQAPQPPAENDSNKQKDIYSVVLTNEEAREILESIKVEGKTILQRLEDLPPARERSEDDPKPIPSPIIKLEELWHPTHFISINIPPSGTALNGVSMLFELNILNGNELTQIIREDGTWIVPRNMSGEKAVLENQLCTVLEQIAHN